MEDANARKVRLLAEDLHCGTPLAQDLLTLAGGDEYLVREASHGCTNVEGVKAYIIDHRFRKLEVD